MKTTSIITLATALMLSASTAAFAQTATTAVNTATDAAASAAGSVGTSGADAGSSAGGSATTTSGTSSSTSGGSMSGSGTSSTSINFDANADGNIDADEIASINASLSTQTGTTVNVDANGDGMPSDDEIAAANDLVANANTKAGTNADSVTCGENGLESTIAGMGDVDMGMIDSATNARVVLVSGCNTDDVRAALASAGATNIQKALAENEAAVQAIESRGATTADVLGANSSGDTLTV